MRSGRRSVTQNALSLWGAHEMGSVHGLQSFLFVAACFENRELENMNYAIKATAFGGIFNRLPNANIYPTYRTKKEKNPPKSCFSSQRNAVHRGQENYPEQNVGKNDIKEKEGDFAMNNIEATQCTQMD